MVNSNNFDYYSHNEFGEPLLIGIIVKVGSVVHTALPTQSKNTEVHSLELHVPSTLAKRQFVYGTVFYDSESDRFRDAMFLGPKLFSHNTITQS